MKEKFCPVCGTSMKYIGEVDNRTVYHCKNLYCRQEVNVLHFPHGTKVIEKLNEQKEYDIEIRTKLTEKEVDKVTSEFISILDKYTENSVVTYVKCVSLNLFERIVLAFEEFFFIIKYGK